jgi:hypothetical protein
MSINQLLANFPTNTQFTVPTSNQGAVTFSVGGPPGGGSVPVFTVTQQVWVALWGSNTTGDGSEENPFATIAFAQSSILDSGPAKFYNLMLYPGTYAENVLLMAFVNIVGFNPSAFTAGFYPARVSGTWALGASFGGAQVGQFCLVTNIDVDGLTTFDYVTLTATSGSVAFANCQLEANVNTIGFTGNATEAHNCQLFGDWLQQGGLTNFFNTNNVNAAALLTVQCTAVSSAFMFADGGSWSGSVTADQNTFNTNCILNFQGFSASRGLVQMFATATTSPAIVANYGDLPENTSLSGAAAELTAQMRISHQFTGITGAVAGLAAGPPGGPPFGVVTTFDFVVPANLIGVSAIEAMQCSCSPVGTNWGSIVGPHGITYAFRYEDVAGVPTVHLDILNTGAAFNITDALAFNLLAYVPAVL